LRTNFFKET